MRGSWGCSDVNSLRFQAWKLKEQFECETQETISRDVKITLLIDCQQQGWSGVALKLLLFPDGSTTCTLLYQPLQGRQQEASWPSSSPLSLIEV